MKRIFTLIALIGMMAAGGYAQSPAAYAQRPLVTLSHNDKLSFFTNINALESALDSAKNGDIIYLSEGNFTSKNATVVIRKRVSIIGCGYKSHILPKLQFNLNEDKNVDSYMDAPLFDGVRLEELDFNTDSRSKNNLKEVTVSKSYIEKLTYGGYAGNEFTIDRCFLGEASFGGSNDSYINNSKIRKLTNNYDVHVVNCNIAAANYMPRILISSIVQSSTNGNYLPTNGSHVIQNSLFPSKEILGSSSNVNYYNCYFENPDDGILNEDLEATMNLQEKGYLGEDGTVVGIYGGMSPYSETPSVPTVDPANSSVTLDKDKNQLNVTITVKE